MRPVVGGVLLAVLGFGASSLLGGAAEDTAARIGQGTRVEAGGTTVESGAQTWELFEVGPVGTEFAPDVPACTMTQVGSAGEPTEMTVFTAPLTGTVEIGGVVLRPVGEATPDMAASYAVRCQDPLDGRVVIVPEEEVDPQLASTVAGAGGWVGAGGVVLALLGLARAWHRRMTAEGGGAARAGAAVPRVTRPGTLAPRRAAPGLITGRPPAGAPSRAGGTAYPAPTGTTVPPAPAVSHRPRVKGVTFQVPPPVQGPPARPGRR